MSIRAADAASLIAKNYFDVPFAMHGWIAFDLWLSVPFHAHPMPANGQDANSLSAFGSVPRIAIPK